MMVLDMEVQKKSTLCGLLYACHVRDAFSDAFLRTEIEPPLGLLLLLHVWDLITLRMSGF